MNADTLEWRLRTAAECPADGWAKKYLEDVIFLKGEVDFARRVYAHQFPGRPWDAAPEGQRIAMLLSRLTNENGRLAVENGQLRGAILKHRDQRGDDRCFLDDYELYTALGEPAPDHACRLNEPGVMIRDCEKFIASRHDPAKPYLSPQREIDRLRADNERLRAELAAATHCLDDLCAEEFLREGG